MKVDTYLLGHWPSERERLHIGAVAPVEYNLKDQAPGRAASAAEPRLASSWHVGGRPPGSQRCLSVAVS